MAAGCECVCKFNINILLYFCIAAVISWFFILPQSVSVVNYAYSRTDIRVAQKQEDFLSHYENMNEYFLEEALLQAERKIVVLNEIVKWSVQNRSKAFLTKKLRDTDEKIWKLEKTLRRFSLIPDENEITIPPESQLGRDLDYDIAHRSMEDHVTVVVFSFEETWDCLRGRIDMIRKEYPNIRIITFTSASFEPNSMTAENTVFVSNIDKEGEALEHMASKLTTEYFLFLSSRVEISPHRSDHGVSWLFHALENLPELDFVGGSFLRYEMGVHYPTLEIPCHRLRLCNYALSQSYEYRYSVDDMMICEETSSSFMGRTNSLKKVGKFDITLHTMATTDFFLRAKGKAVVGLRPEVKFLLYRTCKRPVWTETKEADLKLPLMKKYQLYVVRNSFGQEVLASDSKYYDSVNYHITQWYNGMYSSPLFIRGLLVNLEVSADFFESKNITYFLEAGFPLGAIKTGGIMPWDRDIDLTHYGNATDFAPELRRIDKVNSVRQFAVEGNLTKILMAAGDEGYTEMNENRGEPDPQDFLFIHIFSRLYPVKKSVFSLVRRAYGLHYLKMRVFNDRNMKCIKLGHHACVPPEFADGGGHWWDYYCHR